MSDARRAFSANPVAALLATGFGSGLSPVAPGTFGSLVGLALAWLLYFHTGIMIRFPLGLLMSGLAVGLIGVAVSGPVARALGSEDPGCVVIDEVAGQIVACAAIRTAPSDLISPIGTWNWLGPWAMAFVLFRLFDIWKPLGIRRLQALPGGWGIVADDLLAGAYAYVLVATLQALGLFSRWS
jgi:phosphatidylglycerophosphatase A